MSSGLDLMRDVEAQTVSRTEMLAIDDDHKLLQEAKQQHGCLESLQSHVLKPGSGARLCVGMWPFAARARSYWD